MLSRKFASIFIKLAVYENKADISLMCYPCQMLFTYTLSIPWIQNTIFGGVCLCPIFKLLWNFLILVKMVFVITLISSNYIDLFY